MVVVEVVVRTSRRDCCCNCGDRKVLYMKEDYLEKADKMKEEYLINTQSLIFIAIIIRKERHKKHI